MPVTSPLQRGCQAHKAEVPMCLPRLARCQDQDHHRLYCDSACALQARMGLGESDSQGQGRAGGLSSQWCVQSALRGLCFLCPGILGWPGSGGLPAFLALCLCYWSTEG